MPDHANEDPIIPGPGLRDAFTRRADTWPRHRARARARRTYYAAERRQRHQQQKQQARRDRSLYRGKAAA